MEAAPAAPATEAAPSTYYIKPYAPVVRTVSYRPVVATEYSQPVIVYYAAAN